MEARSLLSNHFSGLWDRESVQLIGYSGGGSIWAVNYYYLPTLQAVRFCRGWTC